MKKTIIITGASSGIGKALAEHLASLDHFIIAVARNKQALAALQTQYPNNIKSVVADLMQQNDLLKIKNALQSEEHGIYLVHNAGIATLAFLEDISEEEWDKHYLTNTKAAVFLTKLLLPHLKNGGRVLNVSTGLAHHALTALSAYGISKAATYMWKEYANAELNHQGIIFGSAMPGIVDTPIQEKLRSFDMNKIPTVKLFKGFSERNELLSPLSAAKFLTWLLLKTKKEEFIKGDWDIYDNVHHKYWAKSGDIKKRN